MGDTETLRPQIIHASVIFIKKLSKCTDNWSNIFCDFIVTYVISLSKLKPTGIFGHYFRRNNYDVTIMQLKVLWNYDVVAT